MQRIQKIRSILEEKQIDAILIKSRSNKRYLGALTGSGVKVLVTRDELYQIMDGRYSNEARETTSGFIPVVHEQGNSYLDEVVRLLGSHARIGIEAGQVLVKEYLSMQEYGLKTVLLEHELEEARRCKDAQEIALVRKACEITDAIFQETISTIRIGMKETEVSALLQYLAIKNGASAMAFDTIVASGVRGSMPHGRPSEKTFEAHEFITIDFGITYQGYQSDMTRTVCIQEPKPELKKIYDLSPEDDPAGIARSDFEKDGYHYTLVDLLRQELPENESRQHTEHVSIESAKKDMESVLALLPQEREFITDDGLMGTLTLKLDTVQVEPSGYGSSTKQLSVKRSYPNLAEQDTQYIPKSIEDGGRTLTLSDIQWQTDNTANMDGYAVGDRFTAVAVYIGSATSSYVKGYTVTADYTGTVSRIALNRVRYVAIFEGVPIQSAEPAKTAGAMSSLRWSYVLIPIGVVAAAGAGVGGALLVKRRKENADEEETEE